MSMVSEKPAGGAPQFQEQSPQWVAQAVDMAVSW